MVIIKKIDGRELLFIFIESKSKFSKKKKKTYGVFNFKKLT